MTCTTSSLPVAAVRRIGPGDRPTGLQPFEFEFCLFVMFILPSYQFNDFLSSDGFIGNLVLSFFFRTD